MDKEIEDKGEEEKDQDVEVEESKRWKKKGSLRN